VEGSLAPNFLTAAVSGAVSVLTTFGIVVFTDRRKVRVNASEREIEARAEFVELLQRRVFELEGRVDTAMRRESELIERFRTDQNDLDRRYRHLTAGFVQYVAILIAKLKALGVTDIPPFEGWTRFMEEGGHALPGWREATDPEGG
jgi:hypothetical protein